MSFSNFFAFEHKDTRNNAFKQSLYWKKRPVQKKIEQKLDKLASGTNKKLN